MEPQSPEPRGLQPLADTLRDYHCARIRAQAVVDLLRDRAVAVGEGDRRRILACEDPAVLRAWALHATTAVGAEEFAAARPSGPRVDLYDDAPNATLRGLGDEFEAVSARASGRRCSSTCSRTSASASSPRWG